MPWCPYCNGFIEEGQLNCCEAPMKETRQKTTYQLLHRVLLNQMVIMAALSDLTNSEVGQQLVTMAEKTKHLLMEKFDVEA